MVESSKIQTSVTTEFQLKNLKNSLEEKILKFSQDWKELFWVMISKFFQAKFKCFYNLYSDILLYEKNFSLWNRNFCNFCQTSFWKSLFHK